MSGQPRPSLVRPTLQTPYHIDFNWWQQNERSWRIHLLGYLSPEHQQAFRGENAEQQTFDVIDPETAEVRQVDGLQYLLMTHYAQRPGFITEVSSLVECIFRLFLATGNVPLTPTEMAERLNRPAETILRTLSGGQIYRGIRPFVP